MLHMLFIGGAQRRLELAGGTLLSFELSFEIPGLLQAPSEIYS